MDDFEGNKSVDSILLVVSCPTGNTHPLCFTPEEEEEAAIAVIETPDSSLTTVSSLSELDVVNNINQILDYEVQTKTAIEDSVAAFDPNEADEDDFVDEPSVLQAEQAAEAIETITSATGQT